MTEISRTEILRRFQRTLDAMADRGKFELAQQGHKATGNLIFSLEGKIDKADLDLLIGNILVLDYGIDVDTGTPASQVPTPADPSAYRKYIMALLDWTFVVEPNIRLGERYRWVNGTAKAHAREGIPTKASVRFSKNGRRKGWIDASFSTQDAQKEFERLFNLVDLFETSFNSALEAAQNSIQ